MTHNVSDYSKTKCYKPAICVRNLILHKPKKGFFCVRQLDKPFFFEGKSKERKFNFLKFLNVFNAKLYFFN